MREALFYLFVIVNTIALILLLIAAYFADGRFPNDPCEMTYMYPMFMENWPPLLRDKCEKTRYRILRYFEGKVTAEFKEPKGYPVLFVPGHLGSFKQARSLGSQVGSNVTVYALDFLDQPAGLAGSLLRRQSEFVNEAAYAVSQLHGGKPVVIVGHSMGAVAAWGSQHLPEKKPVEVSTFFAICAPLWRPILLSEKVMHDFYSEFEHKSNNASENLVLVSLSCGRRDALVPSNLCLADRLLNDSSRVAHSMVSELAGFSVNHQAVLWCKQVSSRIAAAVTLATSLADMEPAKRRDEIMRSLLNRDDFNHVELREKMAQSESVTRALLKPGRQSLMDRIVTALVMSVRSNWTRMFAFAYASICLIFVISVRDSYNEAAKDAAKFVDKYIGVVTTVPPRKRRVRLMEELRSTSFYRQVASLIRISLPTLPLYLGLFAIQSFKDDGAWFLNTWLFFASQGIIQMLLLIILVLRWIFKLFVPSPKRTSLKVFGGMYMTTIIVLYVIVGNGSLGGDDTFHLALCCVFIATFVACLMLVVWVGLTWGRDDKLKTRGSRGETRAIVALGLMHICSVCDSLGCFLLAWDSLMLTSPYFHHEKEKIVVPSFLSSKTASNVPPCKRRLDKEEIEIILTNLVLLIPVFLFLLTAIWLDSKPRFSLVKGEWGDFEFERTAGAATSDNSTADSSTTCSSSASSSESENGVKKKRTARGNKQAKSEVELVPVKLQNGVDDHIEKFSDIEYDESDPPKLVVVGSDVVQVDTLRVVDENSKSDRAEMLHIGRDANLQERRRRWKRSYEAQVMPERTLGAYPLQALLPLGTGLFFAIQNEQLVWIFPSSATMFILFSVIVYIFNKQKMREREVIRVIREQRGG